MGTNIVTCFILKYRYYRVKNKSASFVCQNDAIIVGSKGGTKISFQTIFSYFISDSKLLHFETFCDSWIMTKHNCQNFNKNHYNLYWASLQHLNGQNRNY